MKRSTFYTGLFLFSSLWCTGQTPGFYLGFDNILDNREYFVPYAKHQTIFGVRIDPGVSLTFDTLHSVHAGVNYMYEFGGKLLGVMPQPDLFYHYGSGNLQFYFGSFPRKEVMEYTLFLLTDSLEYYRPNMEGASIQYSWNWGSLHGWVDWTGRATEEIRESILGGFDATIRTGVLYFTTIATRYHLSKTEAVHDRNRIRDDGSVLLVAGIDLSEKTQLDLLDFSTGYAGTYERTMPASYLWFSGWLSELDLKYRIFGFKGSYYLGASSPLRYGDPLYSSGNYGRLDFFVDPFRNPRISSKFGLNLHLLPGDGIYHSMQILIHIQL